MVDSKQGIHTHYNFSSVLAQYFAEQLTCIMLHMLADYFYLCPTNMIF
jgi:hypothetical protein